MKKYVLAALAASMSAAPAAAVVYTSNGNIALTDPTFNRPVSTTSLSSVGTAAHYDTLSFTVDVTGSYALLLTSGNGFDTFLALYGQTFNPTAPLNNLLQVNDDFGGVIANGSGFTSAFTAGTSYVAVLTAFSNTGVGSYVFTITGPGTVTPAVTAGVPEPATWAMMMLGFGGMGYAMRRRSKVSSARIRFV